MPDVSRSDSQRSDASLRPRVSFNRDVHVKRIVPAREASRPLVGAPSDASGDGHLISSTVRKERIKKSKKELAEEAAQVIQQADKLNCFTHSNPRYQTSSPDKFYTLPNRRRKDTNKKLNYPSASLDRKKPKTSPAKPPRTFSSDPVKLKRSASDASHLKRVRPLHDSSDINKKQLSPIIENIQREDYFQNGLNANPSASDNEKENNNTTSSVTQQLKKYIEEVDRQLFEHQQKENARKVDVVVIDIDNAEKVSQSQLSKLKKRIKSITSTSSSSSAKNPAPSLVESVKINLQKPPTKMMHSSQKPADRLPLTKGRTVDRMIRRLNQDVYSPPARPKVTTVPVVASVQHNNNQPFSYTRGLSPDKSPAPVIYAQVVCNNNNNNNNKQTVHTVYTKPQHHSDSDEGLGNEDSSLLVRKARSEKTLTHFGDAESPIKPKYRVLGSSFECLDHFPEKYVETMATRGRGDGMDAIRRRESLSEDVTDHCHENVSARRDLLESRITKRIHNNYQFDSNGNNFKYETSHRKLMHKSTPDIVQQYRNEWPEDGYHHQQHRETYHDSLRRENSGNNSSSKPEKDRFGDSGIENDIRRDSRDFKSGGNTTRRYYSCNESEDEGFASSLLIASERQHTEDNFGSRNKVNYRRKEYDSDRAYSAEDDPYRNVERLDYKVSRDYGNAHRERSIDDGSHYDPRIDSKEFRVSTLKRGGGGESKKPPKPEKKSGLQKVKRLFTRSSDSKKSKEKAPSDMVREGTLRARYTEYKGSRENLSASEPRSKKEEALMAEHRYASRRRLSTPSPSSSPTRELEPKRKSDSLQTSWFKSLDRLSRKKNKKESPAKPEPSPVKPARSLRFFGDTDQDSSDSARHSSTLQRHRISHKDRIRSQSSRELHNISEEHNNGTIKHGKPLSKRNTSHKSMTNISDSNNASRTRTIQRSSLKPPISPSIGNTASDTCGGKFRKKKYEISSVESSTEGDSSQQSQRSVVYLHAATVGDIPGPVHLKQARRAASRDELHVQPQVKTLSRSFSVLAPWKPRHSHEANHIDYSLKKRSSNTATLRKTSTSKENLSNKYSKDPAEGGHKSSTLYKKKGRLPRENSRYNKDSKDAESKKIKSMSVESLRSNGRSADRVGSGHEHKRADISRSISMPKDPEKSAGWFKNNSNVINNNKKKSHHRSDYITQRL